jgi:sugar lactone lactonase YvrE
MEITCILDAQAGLGESPVWSAAEQALYWVDIIAPCLHRLDPATGTRHSWPMPSTIGCAALADDGGLLVALRGGVHHFNPRTQHLRFIADPEGPTPGNRYNDGKIAPCGRFFLGTMDEATLSRPTGALYRLDADGRATRVLDGLIVSNGLAWSADGRTMFHSDSKAQKLMRHDYDPATGTISNPRLIATPGEADGRPDGGATDQAGLYWSAGISAGVLNAYTAEGARVQHIKLPCAAPTMPCFGGPDLKTLYITSARHHVAPSRLEATPLSGGIFALRLDAPGVPIPAFPMANLHTPEPAQ